MSVTDPISDYLTIIRNGLKAKFKYVDVKASNLKRQITKILYQQGFIKRYILIEDGKQGLIRIWLKYDDTGTAVINVIKRASKPGRRRYVSVSNLPRVKNNLGVAILTTPKGVMTDRQASRNHVGGEVICYIW
jgi:small subunit ribosomal protein S8